MVVFKPTVEDQKRIRESLKAGRPMGPADILDGLSGQFAVEYDVERDANGEILVYYIFIRIYIYIYLF